MVVVTAEPSTSTVTPHKKNRRKLNRKSKSASQEQEDVNIEDDVHQDMDADMLEDSKYVPSAETTEASQAAIIEADDGAGDDDIMIDTEEVPPLIPNAAPAFPPLSAAAQRTTLKSETRRIPIPPHRMTPLKKEWVNIFGPLSEMLGLQVRMNVQRRCVEIRTSKHTKEIGALQKGADFVKSFALGFDVNDAIALLRLDDLYLDSFEIKDVKTLHGDHLSRAIGRIAGQDGKTKFTIENTSRTRIVLADTKIHILGSFQNIKIARDAIVSLILGSPPGKVYAGLRTVSSRMRQRAL